MYSYQLRNYSLNLISRDEQFMIEEICVGMFSDASVSAYPNIRE